MTATIPTSNPARAPSPTRPVGTAPPPVEVEVELGLELAIAAIVVVLEVVEVVLGFVVVGVWFTMMVPGR